MKITGAEAIVQILKAHQVTTVFGYPGAAIAPLYDALQPSGIHHVLMRQEQSAAHAAGSYAKCSKTVGVCLVTSGPGATNLITGIANAYADSTPIVAITGQVERRLIGTDAFQEADIKGATAPFCKHNYLIERIEDLPKAVTDAFYIASTGRPGPVLIDIPFDVLMEPFEYEPYVLSDIPGYHPRIVPEMKQVEAAAQALQTAKRPLIIAGGGVVLGDAMERLSTVAHRLNIPVATTLMGTGVLPGADPLSLGMIGSHGVKTANAAVSKADMLLLCGCRVGDRAMARASELSKSCKIIHFDVDPAELDKNMPCDYPVLGDIRESLIAFNQATDTFRPFEAWTGKTACPLEDNIVPSQTVNPKRFMQLLSRMTDGNAIVCADVGQNQIWTANHYQVGPEGKVLLSGGLGCMGYSLPAGIGAAMTKPAQPVITISGDGGFQMLMQELGTICQEGLHTKTIVLNNGYLGMVRELQKTKYSKHYFGVNLNGSPNFLKIADAYGIEAQRITSDTQIEGAIATMLASKGAYLLEVAVDPEESTLQTGRKG